jgi:hypothetical protein
MLQLVRAPETRTAPARASAQRKEERDMSWPRGTACNARSKNPCLANWPGYTSAEQRELAKLHRNRSVTKCNPVSTISPS